MPFPSVYNSFVRPAASDRLNNPSHSALHNTVSSSLGQVEAVIGLSTSSAVGTLMYDVRSPDSNGGGHVQTAVKGGTGQTTFTKGDILVASGPSTLSKLAVGSEGQTLVASVGAATGMIWGNANSTKIVTSASVQTILGNDTPTAAQSILSVSIPSSLLGTNNAVRAIIYLNPYSRQGGSSSVLLRALYGGGTVASVMLREIANPIGSIRGEIRFTLIADNSATAQRGILEFDTRTDNDPGGAGTGNSVIGITYNSNTASVNSSTSQTLGVTAQFQTGQLRIDGYTVEKIV